MVCSHQTANGLFNASTDQGRVSPSRRHDLGTGELSGQLRDEEARSDIGIVCHQEPVFLPLQVRPATVRVPRRMCAYGHGHSAHAHVLGTQVARRFRQRQADLDICHLHVPRNTLDGPIPAYVGDECPLEGQCLEDEVEGSERALELPTHPAPPTEHEFSKNQWPAETQ